jgi:hypothetical protein
MQSSLKRLVKIYGFADFGGNPAQSRGDCRIGMRNGVDNDKRKKLVIKGGEIWW